jgi:hypothetical protein
MGTFRYGSEGAKLIGLGGTYGSLGIAFGWLRLRVVVLVVGEEMNSDARAKAGAAITTNTAAITRATVNTKSIRLIVSDPFPSSKSKTEHRCREGGYQFP